MLNKQKGNMYGFVTHTWNVIKGKCPHNCEYCYMKLFPQTERYFDEKELKTNLGEGNFIFVGSSNDMWEDSVLINHIGKIIGHIENHPKNTYLFQSKNPRRFIGWASQLYKNKERYLFGTTIESNIDYRQSGGQKIFDRVNSMCMLEGFRKFVTIEPIMDFDLDDLVSLIKRVRPEFITIGADSKGHNLPEPSKEKIVDLIVELEKFTKVNLKENLKRLMP
jgi:hypothetical protein